MDYCYGTSREGYMLCIVRSFVFRRRLWSGGGRRFSPEEALEFLFGGVSSPSIVHTLRRVVSPVLKFDIRVERRNHVPSPSIVHTRGEVIPLALKGGQAADTGPNTQDPPGGTACPRGPPGSQRNSSSVIKGGTARHGRGMQTLSPGAPPRGFPGLRRPNETAVFRPSGR